METHKVLIVLHHHHHHHHAYLSRKQGGGVLRGVNTRKDLPKMQGQNETET